MGGTLEGKVAVVTGASKGIGASIARHLAAEGVAVVVNYASGRAAADRVVGAIVAAGGTATAVQADVSEPADVERLFAEAERFHGRLDVLVNNAGVFEFQPLEAIDHGHFRRQFDLNVHALFLTSQRALPRLGQGGGGSIINVSSSMSIAPLPHSSVYAASKGAVDAMTRALAKELGGRGIRVNAVSPGPTETERSQETGRPTRPWGGP